MVSRVGNACSFTKGPFLGFLGEAGKEEVDLRLGRLEKSRGDGDVDFAELSIQRQSIFTFSRVEGGFYLHGIVL